MVRHHGGDIVAGHPAARSERRRWWLAEQGSAGVVCQEQADTKRGPDEAGRDAARGRDQREDEEAPAIRWRGAGGRCIGWRLFTFTLHGMALYGAN